MKGGYLSRKRDLNHWRLERCRLSYQRGPCRTYSSVTETDSLPAVEKYYSVVRARWNSDDSDIRLRNWVARELVDWD